jgi:hypothetical protein
MCDAEWSLLEPDRRKPNWEGWLHFGSWAGRAAALSPTALEVASKPDDQLMGAHRDTRSGSG